MNEQELKKLHEELWTWLSEHPCEHKEDWPRWLFNGGDVEAVPSLCFACEWTLLANPDGVVSCSLCPCRWGTDDLGEPIFCRDEDSAYEQHVHFDCDDYYAKRSELALIVAYAWRDVEG